MESRYTDYENYVKCGKCGWEGFAAQMKHDYKGYSFGQGENADIDVEPMDFCPACGESEEFATLFITCTRNCNTCLDRYVCFTSLKRIPVQTLALQVI